MSLLLSYLRFLLRSTNEHGVHSPFVFDLVTRCFYDRRPLDDYRGLESFRRSLLRDSRMIEVEDFGAGSRVFRSKRRAVAKIAKNAGISRKRARLLLRVVRYFRPNTILEIGTSVGLGTSALSLGKPDAAVTTLEGCPNTAQVAATQFFDFGLGNISIEKGEFSVTIAALVADKRSFDLIFFDGNHSRQATVGYFERLLPTAHNDSVWIFDDIHWSAEMEEAWETIKNHPSVSVSIDTFHWGLVFFRKEQQKEHFVIRA